MSQDNNIVDIASSKKKRNRIPDREKIILAYHAFRHNNPKEAQNMLASVDQGYYMIQFHKDIARALLCWATSKGQEYEKVEDHRKESEFYIIVYNLTKIIVHNKYNFPKSGNFMELVGTLFRDFSL